MGVLDNKCPACNAKINFNPVNQKWDCEYCGDSGDSDRRGEGGWGNPDPGSCDCAV